MQQRFLLQILLLAQHVSGTIMTIIRSSRVLYSGCCLWYFVLWFSSCWSGVELRVMCPVCRMLQHPANISRLHFLSLWPKLQVLVLVFSIGLRFIKISPTFTTNSYTYCIPYYMFRQSTAIIREEHLKRIYS